MKINFQRIGTILSRQFYHRAVLDFVGAHWGLERKRCNHYWATLVGRWILIYIYIYIYAWFFSLLFVLDIYVIIANHCLGRFDWYDSSCSCIYSYPSIWGSGKVYIVYQHVRLASTWKLILQVDGCLRMWEMCLLPWITLLRMEWQILPKLQF